MPLRLVTFGAAMHTKSSVYVMRPGVSVNPPTAWRLALTGIAALSATAAQAQTGSLQIYGRINASIERVKIGDQSAVFGLRDNDSLFGLRGEEDLGGNLRAGFVLEGGVAVDTGAISSNGFFGRKSEVNLSGRFGMLRLGTVISEAYYATADRVNPHNYDTGASADALYAYVSNGKNHVSWRLPRWRQLSVEIGASLPEKTATPPKNAWDLAAQYDVGDWSLGLGYDQWGPARQATLRANYTIGAWTFGGYHQHSRNWDTVLYAVDPTRGSHRTTRVAAMYTTGANELHVNVGHASAANRLRESQALQWTLAYNYNFSQRTKVYALYTRIHNGAQASYRSGEPGVSFHSFAVGIRQFF